MPLQRRIVKVQTTMSRIGKKPVQVPAGVKVQIADRTITVEGPLGKLEWEHRPEVSRRLRRAGESASRSPGATTNAKAAPCTG